MNEACEVENNVIVFQLQKFSAKIYIRKKNGGQ